MVVLDSWEQGMHSRNVVADQVVKKVHIVRDFSTCRNVIAALFDVVVSLVSVFNEVLLSRKLETGKRAEVIREHL